MGENMEEVDKEYKEAVDEATNAIAHCLSEELQELQKQVSVNFKKIS